MYHNGICHAVMDVNEIYIADVNFYCTELPLRAAQSRIPPFSSIVLTEEIAKTPEKGRRNHGENLFPSHSETSARPQHTGKLDEKLQ